MESGEPKQMQPAVAEVEIGQELTPDRARKLFFLSFRFSQGDGELHRMVFQWLHVNYPTYRITETMWQQFHDESKKRVMAFVENAAMHLQNFEGSKETSFYLAIRDFKDILNGTGDPARYQDLRDPKPDEFSETFARKFIEIDLVRMSQSRPREFHRQKAGALDDPDSSQLCDYGFRKEDTGLSEYNKMFEELGAYVLSKIQSKEWNSQNSQDLYNLVKLYNKKHQDHPVSLRKGKE